MGTYSLVQATGFTGIPERYPGSIAMNTKLIATKTPTAIIIPSVKFILTTC